MTIIDTCFLQNTKNFINLAFLSHQTTDVSVMPMAESQCRTCAVRYKMVTCFQSKGNVLQVLRAFAVGRSNAFTVECTHFRMSSLHLQDHTNKFLYLVLFQVWVCFVWVLFCGVGWGVGADLKEV